MSKIVIALKGSCFFSFDINHPKHVTAAITKFILRSTAVHSSCWGCMNAIQHHSKIPTYGIAQAKGTIQKNVNINSADRILSQSNLDEVRCAMALEK